MKIIIGREEQTSEPRLRLIVDGQEKFLATKTHVPKTVSRKHCELTVNGEDIVVRNITDKNTLFVNGQEVVQKKIMKDDKIQLGSGMYTIPVSAILSALGGSVQEAVSIAHLEKVYNDYWAKKDKLSRDIALKNNIARVTSLFAMMIGMLMNSSASPVLKTLRFVLYGFAVLMALCGFSDINNSKKHRELDDMFKDNYSCPNPKCQRTFGNMRYKDLVKYVACPHCKVKFKH